MESCNSGGGRVRGWSNAFDLVSRERSMSRIGD